MIRSACPLGMRSEAISWSDSLMCDCTSPPRWLIPWTSACLRCRPASTAAYPMVAAMDKMPCPPTPAKMISIFIMLCFSVFELFSCGFSFFLKFLAHTFVKGLHAFTTGDDDRHPVVFHFFPEHLHVLFVVPAQRFDYADVVLLNAKAFTDLFDLAQGGRGLSSSHP